MAGAIAGPFTVPSTFCVMESGAADHLTVALFTEPRPTCGPVSSVENSAIRYFLLWALRAAFPACRAASRYQVYMGLVKAIEADRGA
jgi:hypothetical protein